MRTNHLTLIAIFILPLLVCGVVVLRSRSSPATAVIVRVTRLNNADGHRSMNYLVQMPDGRSKTFVDNEPFDSLNEVLVSLLGERGVSRFRNDANASINVDHRPDQNLLPTDDADFAALKAVLARDLDVESLPWITIGEETQMEQKKAAGTASLSSPPIDIR